jgi:TonB family protein
MFESPQPSHRSTRAQAVSFVFHALLVYLLLMPPTPLFVTPYSVQLGHGGTSTALVFTGRNTAEVVDPDDATPTRHKLAYMPPDAKTITLRRPDRLNVKKPTNKPAQTVADAALAGSPFGSVLDGALTGHDVRPALPIHFPDPGIARSEIPSGVEGTVVVEVTIDTLGNVTATKILQRLGYGIDEKVEAAVRNWRFRPAFMDGRAIPSQQDVLYHFPS